ncbi:hypothetical protein H696_04974 [Fonticula alba]|uniref:PCI domain-containing protein n=1 Tax=Fonticula alba TaxID=691883 RepID=A0A058Z429_FONAL|nr:hypothetical protein H696_04974 [Fonticula alba]KCV68683.1 hypothetical protein H696_04974 [Fonticula alba]|eukprot:XP_009497115.1 hypothetical protein H696_04974 [Fonticula alba]
MSKFWGGGSDSSSTDSDSDFSYSDSDLSYSDSDTDSSSDESTTGPSTNIFDRYLSDSDDDSDDDGPREVLSARAKTVAALNGTVYNLEDAMDDDNWEQVAVLFEKLVRLIEKSPFITESVITVLNELENNINELWEDKSNLDHMSDLAKRDFNLVRQKLRRYLADNRESLASSVQADTLPDTGDASDDEEDNSKKIERFIATRGRKNFRPAEAILAVKALLEEVDAESDLFVAALDFIMACHFDQVRSNMEFLPIDKWPVVIKDLDAFFAVLESHADFAKRFGPSLVRYVEHLDNEFMKSLRFGDPHSNAYLERLSEESAVYAFILRAERFFTEQGMNAELCRVSTLRIEHLYWRPQTLADSLEGKVGVDTVALISSLATRVYKHGDLVARARALLCQVYSLALYDHFYQARDLLLQSALQNSITNADLRVQALYNRALVQLGLCAFRQGHLLEAQDALTDFVNNKYLRDLLTQGYTQSRANDCTAPEKEARQPFHLHLSTDLIECVFSVCSLILQVPLSLRPDRPMRINRVLSRNMDNFEKQLLRGPPENTREYIYYATRAMLAGDWVKCQNYINSIRIWQLMPDHKRVLEMIGTRIQEACLKSYVLANSQYFSNIKLSHLTAKFDLDERAVMEIISNMIISRDLDGFVDDQTKVLYINPKAETNLQRKSLQMVDRLTSLVEANEKLFNYDQYIMSKHAPRANQRPRPRPSGAAGGKPAAAAPAAAAAAVASQ